MDLAWKKIYDLIRRTGDRVVVVDGDDLFVAMDLKSYEKLVFGKSEVKGLTEDELLDKMNRDIAVWQSVKKEEETAIDDADIDLDFSLEKDEDEEDNERYYIEPVE